MEYRDFVDTLIEEVRDKTGMEKEKVFFQEADGFLKEDAILMIFGEGKNDYYCCRIYAGELYSQYQSGHSAEQLTDRVVEEICRAKEMKMKEKIEQLRDYVKARRSFLSDFSIMRTAERNWRMSFTAVWERSP